jgi:elongation factor G
VGDILSDLSSKRGRVLGQESLGGGIELIKANVPQNELLRYSIDLKSITSGTGSFEMQFSSYQSLTGKIADDVIAKAKAEEEE